jgi:hypothetical protein
MAHFHEHGEATANIGSGRTLGPAANGTELGLTNSGAELNYRDRDEYFRSIRL